MSRVKKTVVPRRKKAPPADGELKTYYAPKAKKIYRPNSLRYPDPTPGGDR